MPIDVTKIKPKQDRDQMIDSIVGDLFREDGKAGQEAKQAGDTLPVQKQVVKTEASRPDEGQGNEFGGRKMLYPYFDSDIVVEVSDEVDKYGSTYVRGENGDIFQVEAGDLKPLPDNYADNSTTVGNSATPEVKDKDKQSGFWDSYVGDMIERVGAGTHDLAGDLWSLLDKVEKSGVTHFLMPVVDDITKGVKGLIEEKYPMYKNWMHNQAEWSHQYAQTLRDRSNRYEGKDFTDLYKEGDYTGMVGEVFLTASESLPQSVIAMSGGGAGLVLTGATSAVGKYDQLDAMPETKDMPEGTKILNAVATGTFEALFEKLGDAAIGRELKNLFLNKGKVEAEKIIQGGLEGWMAKMFKRYGVLWSPVAEGIEEVGTQICQNITDYCTGVTDEWSPMDGVPESFVYGAAGGAQFSLAGAPIALRNKIMRKKSRSAFEKAKQNLNGQYPDDDVEGFTNGIIFMSPAEQEATIGAMARSGEYSEQQVNTAVDFVNKANHYKAWNDVKVRESDREARRELVIQTALREFDGMTKTLANESGVVQEVMIAGSEEPVHIIKGDVSVHEGSNGEGMVDVEKSSPELYYEGAEGKMQVTTPQQIEKIITLSDIATLRGEFEKQLRQTDDVSEDAPVEAPDIENGINNGDNVIYQNEQGEKVRGIVADAFSDAENVFMSDGAVVLKQNIVGQSEVTQEITEEESTPGKEEETPAPPETQAGTEIPESSGDTSPGNVETFEIEKGVNAMKQADGNYTLDKVFTKSELEKGKKFVERLNQDYEGEDVNFELVELPKVNPDNPLEKTTFAVIGQVKETTLEIPPEVRDKKKAEDGNKVSPTKYEAAEGKENTETGLKGKEVSKVDKNRELSYQRENDNMANIPETDKQNILNEKEAQTPTPKNTYRKKRTNTRVAVFEIYSLSDLQKGEIKILKGVDDLIQYPEIHMPDGNIIKGGDKYCIIGYANRIGSDIIIEQLYRLGYVEQHTKVGTPSEKNIIGKEKPVFGENNKLVSRDRYEELKKRWREKTEGQLNAGFEPELFSIGVEMAMFHIEAGARRFADFAKSMVEDIGENITPYLKAIYEGAKRMPGMEKIAEDMDNSNIITNFNIVESLEKSKDLEPQRGKDAGVGRANGKGKKGEIDLREVKLPVQSYSTVDIETDYPSDVVSKRIKKDAASFVKALADVLGWEHDKDRNGKQEICHVNLPPAGGEVTFILWKPKTDVGIYVNIPYQCNYKKLGGYDNYEPEAQLLWWVTTKADKWRGLQNHYRSTDVTAGELADMFTKAVDKYLRTQKEEETENFKKQDNGQDASNDGSGISVGEGGERLDEHPSVPDTRGSNKNSVDVGVDATGNVSDVQERHPEGLSDESSRRGNGYKAEDVAGREQHFRGERGDERNGVVPDATGNGGKTGSTDTGTDRGNRSVSGHSDLLKHNSRNYVIPDRNDIVPHSEMAKINANILAIKLLKRIEHEERAATREEQAALARYSGWGGLAEVLNTTKTNNENWQKKYGVYHKQIREILSNDEYLSAVNSTINAHYTSGTVVSELWRLAERLGFRGGKVLEPAGGSGNFFGLMPSHLSENSNLYAYELDDITGRLLSKIYPDAIVKVAGYETSKDRNLDLIISNVPFGKIAPYDATNKDICNFSLHNYFVAKGLKQLKPGSLGIFITSFSTLDSPASAKFREWVTTDGNSDFVGAIRLPNNTFSENAGTEVTVDVLVFRKRDNPQASPYAKSFRYALPIKETVTKEKATISIEVNEYYKSNPDMMLGEPMLAYQVNKGGLYSANDVTLQPRSGVALEDALRDAVNKFEENITDAVKREETTIVKMAESGDVEGTLLLRDGQVREVVDGELAVPPWTNDSITDRKGKKVSKAEVARQYIGLRETVDKLVEAELADTGDIEEYRKKLNEQYKAFVQRFGRLNRNLKLRFLQDSDVNWCNVFALEVIEEQYVKDVKGQYKKEYFIRETDIFKQRVSYPASLPLKAENLADAISISNAYKGGMDVVYIGQLLSVPEETVREQLFESGEAYLNPVSGLIEDKETYLTGFVRQKLAEAKEAAETDEAFKRNVKALEKVIPTDIPASQISFQLGSTFIPFDLIENFIKDKLGVTAKVLYVPELGRWVFRSIENERNPLNRTTWATKRMSGISLVEKSLNLTQPLVFDTAKDKTRIKNVEETAAAQAKKAEIENEFVKYISDNPEAISRLAKIYNEKYNGAVKREYSALKVEHFPGANPAINLRNHQNKAIPRCLHGCTLLGHGVGSGKTFTMITAAMEMRRLGIAKKPMIVVQNQTIEQFVSSFRFLYPSAKLLAPTANQMDAKNRIRLFNMITYGDYDAVVVPQSFISKMPDNPERQKAYIREQLQQIQALMSEVDEDLEKALYSQLKQQADSYEAMIKKIDGDDEDTEDDDKKNGRKVKDEAKANLGVIKRVKRQMDRSTDNTRTFEQLGVDALFVDEAHAFKKLGLVTKLSNIKGIDTSGSKRALSLYMKVRYIQEQNGGKNVIFATGTPITNTMAEAWTLIRYLAPEILRKYGIEHFDEFASVFGSIEPSLEFTAAGTFKIVERFKSFVNLPELLQAFHSFADIVLTEDIEEFKTGGNIPKLKNDDFTRITMMQTKGLKYVMNSLKNKLEEWEKKPGREKRKLRHIPLVVFNQAKQAAIDLRLLDANLGDDPGSKTNRVVKEAFRIYQETADYKGAQLIFSDMYQSPEKQGVIRFNLYNDIKDKLIALGVPAEEIAIVNDYKDSKRDFLFSQINSGEVRILIGSTERMGVGVNVQEKLAALHHIDAPPRPMDFEQRNGRILRQGNTHAQMNKPIEILTYGVEKTLDATAYQRLAIKQAFINQMLKGQEVGRVMEDSADEDSATDQSFQEMMATLSGSQYAMIHMQKSYELKKLEMAAYNYKRRLKELEYSLQDSEFIIERTGKALVRLSREAQEIKSYFPNGKVVSVKVNDRVFKEKLSESLDQVFLKFEKKCKQDLKLYTLNVYLNGCVNPVRIKLKPLKDNVKEYAFSLTDDEADSYTGEFSVGQGFINSITKKIGTTQEHIRRYGEAMAEEEARIEVIKQEQQKPFDKSEKLEKLRTEVEDLEKKMQEENLNDKEDIEDDEDAGELSTDWLGDEDVMFREVEMVSGEGVKAGRVRIELEITRLEKMLGVRVNRVRNRYDLPDKVLRAMHENRRYPGVYMGNQVYIVLDEIDSVDEAQRTVLHEVVGHQGIRGLFRDNLGRFCEQVLRALPEDECKAYIGRYGGNRQRAAQEYVAGFAEHYAQPSMWTRVKGIVCDFFRRSGVDLKLTDKDLMYLLWRGVKQLKREHSAIEAMEHGAKDYFLFREAEDSYDEILEEVNQIEFTDVDKLKLHNEVTSRRFKFVESYQDRMLSVMNLQKLIEQKIGKSLPDYMNSYMFENTLVSRNTYETEHYRMNYLRPLTAAIASLQDRGMSRREIENYVMVVHGLERNTYMREKALQEWLQPLEALLEWQKDLISQKEYNQQKQELEAAKQDKIQYFEKIDFSGINVIKKELPDEDINGFIETVESTYGDDVAALWDRIREATQFTVRKWYDCGLMSKEGYEKVTGMYEHYIPLRGFDETIASDVYEYFTEPNSNFNSPLRVAKGRTSRADNVFANIASMAESAIVGGNKNLLKLHLFHLAEKYPSDYLSINKAWYEYAGDDTSGEPVFKAVFPAYDDDMAVYRQNVADFKARMEKLQVEGKAYTKRQRLGVNLRMLNDEPEEHTVRVQVSGEEYAVLVHGDPRVAQAVNGLNDEERTDNRVVQAIRTMNRQMAANFTTRNPAFVISNFTRDFIFSVSTLSVKEGGKYRNRFVRNIGSASGAIRRYLAGLPDYDKRVDVLFKEFLENGGETGYTALHNMEKLKKMVDREIKNTHRGKVVTAGIKILDFFEAGNRWAEDLSRFSTYLTSREFGRTVLRSVSDAKEVTVNFNRRGSGANGAQVFRSLYLFFNAAVQSLANFGNMAVKHPRSTASLLASYAAIGALVPMLVMAIGGDDALKEYLNLPDYVRKNNLCFYLGKKHGFVTLPLPIELRAFFGWGDSAFRYLSGDVAGDTACGEVIMGILDLLPLNPVGGDTPFVPDAIKPLAQSFFINKDFTGRPIARVTPYNQYVPEYKRVYRGTGEFFVKSSEVLNYFTGGDYATRGGWDKSCQVLTELFSADVNLSNPAAIEHLFEAYMGGTFTTVNQAMKTVWETGKWAVTGENNVEARNIPVVNRFYNTGSIYSSQAKTNEKYFNALDELKETQSRMRRYTEAMANGEMDMDKAMTAYERMANNGTVERSEIIKFYSKEISKMNEGLYSNGLSDEETEEMEAEIYLLKEQMLAELAKVRERVKTK